MSEGVEVIYRLGVIYRVGVTYRSMIKGGSPA